MGDMFSWTAVGSGDWNTASNWFDVTAGNAVNNGTIIGGGGMLSDISGTGQIVVKDCLSIGASVRGMLDFALFAPARRFIQADADPPPISGFDPGDLIDLDGVSADSALLPVKCVLPVNRTGIGTLTLDGETLKLQASCCWALTRATPLR
jgi:hypothetical protein